MRIRNRWVPFIVLLGICLIVSKLCHAMTSDFWVNCSTNLAGTSTTSLLPLTRPGDILGMVTVSTRSAVPAWLSIYDSSNTNGRLIDTIDLSTGSPATGAGYGLQNETIYHLRLSTGITVTKTDGTSRANIYWHSNRALCQ